MSQGPIKPDGVYVVGIGAQTPVGRSAAAASAAVRSGICAYAEHPSLFDQFREPIVAARAEWLEVNRPVPERVLTLATDAIAETLAPLAGLQLHGAHSTLHLSLMESGAIDAKAKKRTMQALARHIARALPCESSLEVVTGGGGSLIALSEAVHSLRSGKADLSVVCAADSWLHAESISALDQSGRLHSPQNSWGFTPGEAAGLCLLANGQTVVSHNLPTLAEILAVGIAQEPNLLGTQTVCVGDGLGQAFRSVLRSDYPVSRVYCDLNGETYRADEYGFAVCRNSYGFADAGRITAPAECWGDVGCASGLLNLILATQAWKKPITNDSVSLVWSSAATGPTRAALLVCKCGQEGRL